MRKALTSVEQAGRTALAEMRRLLGAMRSDGEAAELSPQPGLDNLDALLEDVRRAGLPVELHVEGEAVPLPRAHRPVGVSDRAGGADQRAQARAGGTGPTYVLRYGATTCASRCATTAGRPAVTAAAAGSWACASGSRSTAAR